MRRRSVWVTACPSRCSPGWILSTFVAALLLLPAEARGVPNLTLTAPTAGTVSGNVSWSATAGDPRGTSQVSRVELLVDGAVVEADRSAPYGGWWDTTRDFDGIHQIQVRAYDTSGGATARRKAVRVANALTGQASNAGGIGVVGSDLLKSLELGRQTRTNNAYWSPYNGADSPEGAFMGWMNPGAAELPATMTLPRTLQPGRYSLFVKGYNFDRPIDVHLSIGGGATTVATEDRDNNGAWSISAPLTIKRTSNQLTLTLRKRGSRSDFAKFLLRGLYVTANANETVLESDAVVDLTYPTRMENGQGRPGNLVENSSFETGIGHGWGLSENRQFSVRSIWDDTEGRDGGASVRLPLSPGSRSYGDQIGLVSKLYSVTPNTKYTLAAWVRTERRARVDGSLSLVNSFSDRHLLPARSRPPHSIDRPFTVGERWTRVSVTGYLLEYPTADYQMVISGEDAPGRHLWVDGVSLTEGGSASYSPKLPLEIGLQSDQPSNLYYEDEPVVFKLRAANGTPRPQGGTARYEIYDFMNRKVKSGSIDLSVAASTTEVRDLDLGIGNRGSFRVVLWIAGREGSEEEVLFGVVPRPQVAGADPGSSMGIHSNFSDFQYDALEKLGIKWDRAMSPGAFFRWSLVEPADDRISWFDSKVNSANRRGVQIMGTLGGDSWPAWADAGGKPNLAEWREFVDQMVDRYRGRVRAWEICNEPDPVFQPDFYARMLKLAAEAIRRSDPDAQVVGMGGASEPDYVLAVIAALEREYPRWNWRDHVDVLSTHIYPPTETAIRQVGAGPSGEFRNRVLGTYGKPVWNTEGGHWDSGFFHGSNAPSAQWGRYLFPFEAGYRYTESSPLAVENVSINFLETMGNGLGKYFYYDFRTAPSPSLFRSHPSALEYDDSVRPKGIALSVLAKLFDHSVGLGLLASEDDHTRAFLFNRGGTALIALYSTDNASRSVALSGLTPDQIRLFDIMGNPLPVSGTTVRYGRQPVYLEGQGITVAALRAAFERGTIWNRADNGAPSLTINRGPRAAVPLGSPVSFSWGAADDTYTPGLSDQNAITYSYRVEGSPHQNSWSPWSATASADFSGLPQGRYLFQVKARDQAGNESAAVSRWFSFGLGAATGVSSATGATPPFSSRTVGDDLYAPAEQRFQPTPSSRTVTVVGRRLKMSHGGVVRLRLSCQSSEHQACSGTVSLETLRKVELSRGAFLIADGRTGVVRIRLSSRTQRLVRKHRLVRGLVTVEGDEEAGNATSRTTGKRVVLRAAKHKNGR